MTATALNKYKTVVYNEKGQPISVQLNLKNKMMKKAYERAMEELEDMLDLEEAKRRLSDGTELIPWEEAKKSLYKKLDAE